MMSDETISHYENFQILVLNSNISETFDFNDIWERFHILRCIQIHDAYAYAEQVLKFCGDIKKGIQVLLYFAIVEPKDNFNAKIKCKFEIKSLQRINIEKMLDIWIEYVP